jgi:hypothetical protein
MASEQENRIVAEVMDNMKMSETEESSARRYVRRAVDKILIYCCREDLPERLEGTAAQIAGYVKGRSAGLHRKRNIIRHPWRHNDFLPRSKRFQERHGGLHEEL